MFYMDIYVSIKQAILVTSGDYFRGRFKVNILFIGIAKNLINIYKYYKKLSLRRKIELRRFYFGDRCCYQTKKV